MWSRVLHRRGERVQPIENVHDALPCTERTASARRNSGSHSRCDGRSADRSSIGAPVSATAAAISPSQEVAIDSQMRYPCPPPTS